MEGKGKQGKWACMACSPYTQQCCWRQKMRQFPYTEYYTPLMRRSDPYRKCQTKTNEGEDWCVEEKLNLLLAGRWTFVPSSPGTAIAEGSNHGAQGSAAAAGTSVGEPVLLEPAVWSGWNSWVISSKDPITDAWTDDLLMLLENSEFIFQASRQGYC